jgi:hypothetical protein
VFRDWVNHTVWVCVTAALGLGAVGAFVFLGRGAPHPAGGGVVGYALGIVGVALILVAAAYWIREQRRPRTWGNPAQAPGERPSAALAQARERLADLQAEMAASKEASAFALRTAARRVVKEAGLHFTYRVTVHRDVGGRAYIRLEPKMPLPALSNWLLGHQYLGALSLLVVGLHCGFRAQSVIGWTALGLLVLVVLSGVVGTLIYMAAPPRLTAVEAAVREGQPADPAQKTRYERALKMWLYVHAPLTIALLVVVVAHVVAVIYY